MTKKIKQKLKNTTATILATTIILASGGYTAIISALGITKNDTRTSKFNNKPEKSDSQFLEDINSGINNRKIISINEQEIYKLDKENSKYEYKHISQYFQKESFIYELETTEAISQEENINRLIRKRKKETQDKVNI